MKKSGLFILVLFLTTFVSFASALTATQITTDVAVIPEFNQPGEIKLEITGATPGNYNLYTLTAVKILPSTPFYFTAGRNRINLDIYPTKDLVAQGPAAYSFSYNIRNMDTNENFEDTMTIRVVRFEDAFELSSDSNSPDSENVTFYLRNKESIDLTGVHARFSSIFFDFEQTFDIKANEKKVFTVQLSADKIKKIEAGSYLLKANVETDRGDRTLEGRIFLDEKKGIRTTEEVKGFFVVRETITKLNYGNVPESVSIQVEKNIITRLFTSFSEQPDVVNRDGLSVIYSWNRRLGPSESLEVVSRTNYLLPLLIILAVILLIIGYRRYTQTKIEVEKSVVPVRTKTGHFALKIKLHIKAKKSVQNVSLIDRIPGVVQIYEKFESNVKPSKVDPRNRRIQWDLGEMNAGEERMFSYMVYSTVGVVGKFALPQALAVFEKDGQIHEVDSNAVYFLAEQRAMDE